MKKKTEASIEKTCPHCGCTKPLELFHKDKNSNDGRTSWCKDCTKEYMKNYALRKKLQKEAEKAETVPLKVAKKKLKEFKETHPTPDFSYKTCTKCNSTKKLVEFHKNAKSKDGHAAQCKECKKSARKK